MVLTRKNQRVIRFFKTGSTHAIPLLYLIFLLISTPVLGQYEALSHQPFYQQIKTLKKLYDEVLLTDSVHLRDRQEFYRFAKHQSDLGLQLEAQILEGYAKWKNHPHSVSSVIDSLKTTVAKAAKNNLWIEEIRAYYYLSFIYWKEQRYTELFETYYVIETRLKTAEKTLSSQEDRHNYALIATLSYTDIGRSHYFFKDYKKALFYLKKTIPYNVENQYPYPKLHAWNVLGLTYYELGELDQSSRYYKKLLHTSYDVPPLYQAIAGGNLGINYYKMGQYKKAIPLLKENIKVSEDYKIHGSAMESAIWLGNLYLKLEKMDQAEKYFSLALKLHPQSSNDDKIHHSYKLYKGLSKFYAIKGDQVLAQKYIDSTEKALQKHNKNFSALKLIRANQIITQQQKELLQKERLQEVQERNLIIGIIITLLLVLVVAYIYKNKYNQKKIRIKELANARSRESLEHARQELDNLTQKIKKNNRLMAQLKKNDREKNQETIRELRSYTILTRSDWRHYQQLFEKVYPNYLKTLRTQYPDLTPGEVRHLCLERVHLSPKEMASILGVSNNSIMVTRHRIRKKLNFKSQKELQHWVINL